MNKLFLGFMAVAIAIQLCIEAAPTNTTTSKTPLTSTQLPASISSATPDSTTEVQPTTTEKVETTTKRLYDCSQGAGLYPSPYSCSQYYVCVQPYIPAYVFDCPANLWYDASLQQCNYPQLVDCELVNIRSPSSFIVKINAQNATTEDPSTIETTTTSNSTTSFKPITATEVPTTPTDIPVTATAEKVETTTNRAYDCSNGLGQYPSPYSCSQYYVCVQPYIPAYVFDCPANLWYDPKLEQCNYQQLVYCDITN